MQPFALLLVRFISGRNENGARRGSQDVGGGTRIILRNKRTLGALTRRSAGAQHEKKFELHSERTAAAAAVSTVGKFESRVEMKEREDEEATSILAEIKKTRPLQPLDCCLKDTASPFRFSNEEFVSVHGGR